MFDDMIIEGNIVLGEVGREEIEIKLMVMDGDSSEYEANSAHAGI